MAVLLGDRGGDAEVGATMREAIAYAIRDNGYFIVMAMFLTGAFLFSWLEERDEHDCVLQCVAAKQSAKDCKEACK